MLLIALILFLITTIMGLYLSLLVFLKKEKPMPVIIIHGLLSVSAFIILFYYYPDSFKSMMLFLLGNMFGVILLYQHLTNKKFTKWFCFGHGILAIAGLFTLTDLTFYTNNTTLNF